MEAIDAQTQQRADGENRNLANEPLDRLDDVETELDFVRLSDDVHGELLEAGLQEYQRYLEELEAAKSDLDGLLASTSATLAQLSSISASFKEVDAQTRTFNERSTGLLTDERRHERLAEDVALNLQYYEPLERITRRMNAPGAGNFVRTTDFSDMLVTLDECIDYMDTHASHKEAAIYRSRYKLLLTRALTLIRNTFTTSVRETSAEVAKRLADVNDTTISAILYTKFRVEAGSMKQLGLEIHKRAGLGAAAVIRGQGTQEQEGEYFSLLNELHQAYAVSRGRLILPIITKRLGVISQAPSSRDLVGFARTSVGYIRGICMDEFELWHEWFYGNGGLYGLLESMCEPLYDHLRPRIIHETKVSKLCSLVTLVQTRYLRDPDEDDGPPDPNELDFGTLIEPVLEDAQTRLVFRTLATLREDIENFKPQPEDIDYPRRTSQFPTSATKAPLSGRRISKEPTTPLPKDPEVVDEDSGDEGAGSFPWTTGSLRSIALQNSYPTLPRAVRLLSRIYRLVNSSVFDDLAHQIVHQTTASLHKAASLISQKATLADGQLFLLKHLLLLKSQIVAFDIEFVTPDVAFDFSGMTNTFYELRDRGGLFNPRSWLKLVGGGLLPRVIENMLDAKVELDGRLRTVINEFCAGWASDMTKSLTSTKKPVPEDAVLEARRRIEKEVPVLRAKLEQYLDDFRTKETLVAAVEEQVVQSYDIFFDSHIAQGKANGISRKGKGREDGVWDIDTFAEWAESVFNVALAAEGDADETGGSRSLSRSRSS